MAGFGIENGRSYRDEMSVTDGLGYAGSSRLGGTITPKATSVFTRLQHVSKDTTVTMHRLENLVATLFADDSGKVASTGEDSIGVVPQAHDDLAKIEASNHRMNAAITKLEELLP